MLTDTWDIVFSALYSAGVGIILVLYLYPQIFQDSTSTAFKNGPLYMTIIIYILIWLIALFIYYFMNGRSNAEVKGLWNLKPAFAKNSDKYDIGTGHMIPASGMVNVLSELDGNKFLTETFTFGFFVSIDHSSIETIGGESLAGDYKPYQLIVSVPGVYDIYVDPFHEMLSIEFHSYQSSSYVVTLPTLKIRRWHQILISIEGRTADIYQNGMLLKSVGLKNVISSRPGKPKINMNPEMFATIAFAQVWPLRLADSDIVSNYRWNTDAQGIPFIPTPMEKMPLGFPSLMNLNFSNISLCVGSYCTDTLNTQSNAISYVNYDYA